MKAFNFTQSLLKSSVCLKVTCSVVDASISLFCVVRYVLNSSIKCLLIKFHTLNVYVATTDKNKMPLKSRANILSADSRNYSLNMLVITSQACCILGQVIARNTKVLFPSTKNHINLAPLLVCSHLENPPSSSESSVETVVFCDGDSFANFLFILGFSIARCECCFAAEKP